MNPIDAINRLIDQLKHDETDACVNGREDEAERLKRELEEARQAKAQFEALVNTSNAFLNAPHRGTGASSLITVSKARHDLHNALQPFKEPLE